MNTEELVNAMESSRNSVPFELGLSGRKCEFVGNGGEVSEGIIRGSYLSEWPIIVIESEGKLYQRGFNKIVRLL